VGNAEKRKSDKGDRGKKIVVKMIPTWLWGKRGAKIKEGTLIERKGTGALKESKKTVRRVCETSVVILGGSRRKNWNGGQHNYRTFTDWEK